MYHSALNTFKQTHELHIGIKKAPEFFHHYHPTTLSGK